MQKTQTPADNGLIWTTKELADTFNITTMRVCQLADEGVFEKAGHGKYKVVPSLVGWVEELRKQNKSRAPKSDPFISADGELIESYSVEKARHLHTQTEIEKLKLAYLQGD